MTRIPTPVGLSGRQPQHSVLVSTSWLRQRIATVQDPPLSSGADRSTRPLLILDATVHRSSQMRSGLKSYSSGLDEYLARHIPTAHFADLITDFSDPTSPLPFTSPTASQFAAAVEAFGLRFTLRSCDSVGEVNQEAAPNAVDIVIYDQNSGAWAARLWWLFCSLGVAGVRVLDGGMRAWVNAGLPTNSGAEALPEQNHSEVFIPDHALPGFFTAETDVERLSAHLVETEHRRYQQHSPAQYSTALVCALREEQFTKTHGSSGTGHIPGSVNFPFLATQNEDGTLSLERTRRLARSLGLATPDSAEEPHVLYCGGGINAAGLALALHEVGVTNTSVYDGSMSQWRADPDHPVV